MDNQVAIMFDIKILHKSIYLYVKAKLKNFEPQKKKKKHFKQRTEYPINLYLIRQLSDSITHALSKLAIRWANIVANNSLFKPRDILTPLQSRAKEEDRKKERKR